MTSNPSMPCRDITELCPTLERGCKEFLKRCKTGGLNVLITQTYRTAAYQASLYAQGRTKPGSVITNLNGYGNSTSPHQHRIAFDICKNVKEHEYDDYSFFKACGKIWTDMGGTWGGNWTGFVDNPHFEFTNNAGYAPFRTGYVFPDGFKMPWEKVASKPEPPKEDKEVIGKAKIAGGNLPVKEIPSILNNDFNFIKIRDMVDEINARLGMGIVLKYDDATKTITVAK